MGCDLKSKWRLIARIREGEGSLVVNGKTVEMSDGRYDTKWQTQSFTTELKAIPEEGWEFDHWMICTQRCEEVTKNPVLVDTFTEGYRLHVVSVRAYFVKKEEELFDPWEYDKNDSGEIDQDEALQAVSDYFAGSITKDQAFQVMSLYFGKSG